MEYRIINYISIFLALLVVIPAHEFAHALTAVKFGDYTPKMNGRLTLNPLAHFDPVGLIAFVLVGFGWAKPTPINPYNFKRYKSGCFWVSVAGVITNYVMSFLVYPLAILSFMYVPEFGYFGVVLKYTLYYIFRLGLVFFVFNLLPIYPLDGFRVVDVFNKKNGAIYRFLRNYGIYVLYALCLLGLVADFINIPELDILGMFINIAVDFISKPITLFWGLFF